VIVIVGLAPCDRPERTVRGQQEFEVQAVDSVATDEDNGGVVAAGGAEPTRALFEALSPRGQKRRLREGHDAGGISKIPTLNGTARRSV
jgi:hypothetical protein